VSATSTFLINGREHQLELDSDVTLHALLRDHLGLTGTKYGCGEAQCGACTVLIEDAPKRSCVTPASAVAILLDRKDLPSSGAGECPIIAIAPAIANAIYYATGNRLRSLPLPPRQT
jgi:ferredoxin